MHLQKRNQAATLNQLGTHSKLTGLHYGPEGIPGMKAEVHDIMDQMQDAGTPMAVPHLIPHILGALPGRFGNTKDTILARLHNITLEEVFTLLEAKEINLKRESDLFRRDRPAKQNGNWRAGQQRAGGNQKRRLAPAIGVTGEGSNAQHGVGGGFRNNPNVRCYNCGDLGHIAKYCPKPDKRNQSNQGGQGNNPNNQNKRKAGGGGGYKGGQHGGQRGGKKPFKKVKFSPRPPNRQVHFTHGDDDMMDVDDPPLQPPPPPPRSALRNA